MNRICLVFFVFLVVALVKPAAAQDTLPKFRVINASATTSIISWVNNYPVTKQISIQRSHDSLTGFKTILTVADPSAVQNGFADRTTPNDHMFYRLFINLDQGKFFFTPSRKAFWDTVGKSKATAVVPVQKNDGIVKDTTAGKPVVVKPAPPKKPEWVPSIYVYTNKDGYVLVNLPDADRKKYRIRFYEEDETFLFELKTIKHPALTLDKVNFYHAGWFRFELFDEERLVEKNKFYLPKDF